mgnify:CR=1 FL=1
MKSLDHVGGIEFVVVDDEQFPVGRFVQAKQLHRNESIAVGIVRAKNRTMNANADLVEDPERSERVRRRGADVGVQ